MAVLTDDMKLFIVTGYALFDSVSLIQRGLEEEFGVTIEHKQINKYNPLASGVKPAKKWVAIFHETRKQFMDEALTIPIARKMFRLHRLQKMHDVMFAKKNYVQAAALLEQAAKESGGLFTNEHKVKTKSTVVHRSMSDEEKRNTLSNKIAEALEVAAENAASVH